MGLRNGLAALAVLTVLTGGTAAAGDTANGEKIFKKCQQCHTLDAAKHKIGPSLKGVVGRQAGTANGYKYSKAMVAHGEGGAVWDEGSLDAYLTKPRDVVKGTKMAFPGLKKGTDRADVIAYLVQFSE
jgi:cytochrome c